MGILKIKKGGFFIPLFLTKILLVLAIIFGFM
jgi:hypothetical protein